MESPSAASALQTSLAKASDQHAARKTATTTHSERHLATRDAQRTSKAAIRRADANANATRS